MSSDHDHPRVLLVGGDARTDALGAKLEDSAHEVELYAISPVMNPGLFERCRGRVVLGDPSDLERVIELVASSSVDLVVVGPEAPLAAGLVDAVLDRTGVPCFGPRRAAAQIETSKSFTRALLDEHGIDANPRHRSFTGTEGLRAYLESLGEVVVKPDGLTGGKGVKVLGEHLASLGEAIGYASDLVRDEGSVVVEERLEGEEFSLQSLSDGEHLVHCPLVQDHKRAGENDTGPNTGGMGSYSDATLSLPFLSARDVEAARRINEAVLPAIASRTGSPFRGVLYGGFIATAKGVRLIEYNARFADPEAINVLALLDADLFDVLLAAATKSLAEVPIAWKRLATVCKYMVPRGYPSSPEAGGELRLDEAATAAAFARPCASTGPGCAGSGRIFWGSVALDERDGARRFLLGGSRSLAVLGVGASIDDAEKLAERLCAGISGPLRHRADIGTAAAIARRTAHLSHLRAT